MTAAIAISDASLATMWQVSGEALHSETYRRQHAAILAAVIGEKDKSILDTACGVGFPSLDLLQRGFTNIVGADADENLLAEFASRLRGAGASIPLVKTTWQNITSDIADTFDVVLNVDASIGFMDSWGDYPMEKGKDRIFARVRSVLANFYRLTKPDGMLIIGLQKNNNKGNREYVEQIGDPARAIDAPTARWEMSYDWDTRVKTWINTVAIRGKSYQQTKTSYLFDKFELSQFLYEVGFDRVYEIATPVDLYDDLICARKDG